MQGEIIKEIPVSKAEYTVGRLPDNDIIIDHPAVSGHHCKITLVGDTFFIEDLKSSNGVFLNAKKTFKSGLKNNDVIGIVKHTLKFIDDPPPTPETDSSPDATVDATMMIAPDKQKEIARAAATATQKPAMVRVIKGVVSRLEYELKGSSTYIGKSDRVQIRIKGKGLFGSAPENAAMVARRLEGYFIVPVQEGYARLNGRVLIQTQPLKDGDVIEVGGTTLLFENASAE
jgi:pSer/pThr/pTyr-binding forkhead associated (FHA) protein